MKVYKYRTFNKNNINSLLENYFWCASIESLNDVHEGKFTDKQLSEEIGLLNIFSNSITDKNSNFDKFDKSLDDVKSSVLDNGIFSTSQSPYIQLQWVHYAQNDTGFCVEYDLDELKAKNSNIYDVIEVTYLDNPQDLEFGDFEWNSKSADSHLKFLKKTIGTKGLAWQYEQEIRIISPNLEKNYHRQNAIKAIYFGIKANEDDKNSLMKNLANRGIEFRKITLNLFGYGYSSEVIPNPFDSEGDFEVKFATIEPFAINEGFIEDEYKPFIPYLHKVAKIMQKDPDCEVIEYIDFSTDSTLDNPIIFINFQEKNKPLVNSVKRFTLSEIDNILGK